MTSCCKEEVRDERKRKRKKLIPKRISCDDIGESCALINNKTSLYYIDPNLILPTSFIKLIKLS